MRYAILTESTANKRHYDSSSVDLIFFFLYQLQRYAIDKSRVLFCKRKGVWVIVSYPAHAPVTCKLSPLSRTSSRAAQCNATHKSINSPNCKVQWVTTGNKSQCTTGDSCAHLNCPIELPILHRHCPLLLRLWPR